MSVDDLWYLTKRGPDGERVPSRGHGRGKRFRVRYTDPGGRERARLFERLVDAKKFDATTRADIARGAYIDPDAGRTTFKDYAEEWRANQIHADTTRLQIETLFRIHVYPVFGGRPLSTIRASHVQALVRGLSDTHAPATVLVVYRHITSVFLAAVADKVIPAMPYAKISLPEVEPARVEPLPVASVEAIRDSTALEYRVLVDIGAMAGLRQGEAFGLEVGHVDFLRRTLRVEQQLKTVPGQAPFLAPPKTRKSRRLIPISKLLVDRLAAHLKAFPAVEVEIVDKTGREPVTRKVRLICTTSDDEPIRRAFYSTSVWRPAIRRARIEGSPTFHDLRHFFASALIAHGASVVQVQARLGHASANETLGTYSHLWPDDDDRTRQAIEDAFAPKLDRLRSVP